jgi:hypothetical protein
MPVTILDFDSLGVVPDSADFGITYNTLIHTSPLSGATQTLELPGARWKMRLSFRNLEPSEGRKLASFLTRLRGSAGRFYCHDFGRPSPQNTATPTTSTTLINTVSTGADNVYLTGYTTGSLTVGDMISIGNNGLRELKMIVSDTGGGSYAIEPKMRATKSAGTPVIVNKASTVFMLSSDEQAYWSTRSKAFLSDIDIDAVEIFLKASDL